MVAGASCAVEGVRRAVEKVAFTSVRLTTGAVCTPGEILPLPFLRYRRVKIQGRGRVGDRSTVPLLLKL